MSRGIITISENGIVTMPNTEVWMSISSDMEILSHKLEKMEKEICDAI